MKIGTEELRRVVKAFYGTRSVGQEVAEKVGVEYVTLWLWLNKRGIDPARAVAVADGLRDVISDLIEAEADLRNSATRRLAARPSQ